MYRFEVRQKEGLPLVFPLREGTHAVGRNADNDIVLNDASVSRSHCLIYVRPNYVEIEDLGSANGVFIRDQRVASRTELPFGEEIRIGDTRAILMASESEASRETTIFVRKEDER